MLLFFAQTAFAQRGNNLKTINLPKFDLRWYHFGMALGYNSSDFYMDLKPDFSFGDSLISLRNISQPGFNINIVTAVHIGRGLSVRFIPGISPKDRVLEYTFLNSDLTESEFRKRIESFYLEFPVLLKYRTDRVNNFAAYIIGGGKYALDMQSQKDVDNSLSNIVIKTTDKEWAIVYGGGFDFFLPYFKFGIELRHEIGLYNVFIDDNTIFSRPISSLRSQNFVLSFTFEG